MNSYSPCLEYCPPIGRVAVQGKTRAEIDKIRKTIEVDNNSMAIALRGITDQETRTLTEMSTLNQKTESETRLLDQKAITELGQTTDYIPYEVIQANIGLNEDTDISGIIGKQRGLFQKQTDGFDRDAEQKLAKIMVDTWSVRQTTDGEDSATAGVDNAEVDRVLNKAKQGINY